MQTDKAKIALQSNEVSDCACPECGGELKVKHGRYGDYIGCKCSPKCKFTLNLDSTKYPKLKQAVLDKYEKQKALFDKGICPECGGTLVHKVNHYKNCNLSFPFIGCTGYPDCTFKVTQDRWTQEYIF